MNVTGVSETWLKTSKIAINWYYCNINNRPQQRDGGVALFISSRCLSEIHSFFSYKQKTIVSSQQLVVFSINHSLHIYEMWKIIKFFVKLEIRRSLWWGNVREAQSSLFMNTSCSSDFWRIIKSNELSESKSYSCNLDMENLVIYDNVERKDFAFQCIDINDLDNAFSMIKYNGAGLDGFTLKYLCIVYLFICNDFLHIGNTILLKSIFPLSW